MNLASVLFFLCLGVIVAGCSTSSTIDSRKKERPAAYADLPAEQKKSVDQGQIKVGMSADAVYIAWGPPAQILESESAEGHVTTWIYTGQWMEEARIWAYREVPYDGTYFLERYVERDYYPRSYVRAEIVFQNGVVSSWRTLPRPVY
jgi:hypothetical protein